MLGITEIRFTGGEPILRRGLTGIVAAAAALAPRAEISMTTNGIGLVRLAGPLHEAGLDRINVSLDTLDPATFVRLARRDRLGDVLEGLAAAAATGLAPVKVNAVLMRGVNDHEAVDLLQFCLDHGYQLRFIEQMPLDAQHGWRREDMVTADEILQPLSAKFTLTPDAPGARGSAPAETFLIDGGPAKVGVIGSVTRPFCGSCDRVRLTADGQVRNCLFAREESDLRTPLRAGADAETGRPVAAARWPASCPATASTIRGSSSPPGPCRPSAADRRPPVDLRGRGRPRRWCCAGRRAQPGSAVPTSPASRSAAHADGIGGRRRRSGRRRQPPRHGRSAQARPCPASWRRTGYPVVVECTTEQPPGAGPVPALRAGLRAHRRAMGVRCSRLTCPSCATSHLRALLTAAAAQQAGGAMLGR